MPENFNDLVDLAMQQPGRTAMRPVVEKEILHYDIFYSLDRAGLLNDLVFQGGTSLRLCRGSNRFSEDLDFAGGRDFTSQKMQAIKACIESIWAEDMDSWSRLRNPRKWLLCQTTRTFVSTNGRSVSRRLPSGVTFHASVSSWRSRTCTDAGRRQVFGLSQEYDRPGAWRHGGPPSRRAGCARPRFQDVADSASQLDAFAMRPLEPT